MTRKKTRKLVVAIGIFKLIKAAMLVAVAVGMLHLIGKDPESTVARWLGDLGLDARSGSLRAVLGKLGGLSIGQLEEIGGPST